MEVVFYIDTEKRVIIEGFRGDVTLAKAIEVFPDIWNHPDYSPAYDGIVDFRDCNFLFSPEQLQMMFKRLGESDDRIRGRIALLVSDPMAAAMGAMYSEEIKSVHGAGLFCSNSEVINYLGVDPGIFNKLDDPGAVRVEVQ